MRPDCLVLVTGSGTGVGKTWVAAALAATWRAGGATVAARKPVLSFDPAHASGGDDAADSGSGVGYAGPIGAAAGASGAGGTGAGAGASGTAGAGAMGPSASAGASAAEGATDDEVLAAATGERPGDVCPEHRRYPLAMAPPVAAAALGRPAFTVAELAGELRWPPGPAVRYGLVEGVGGPRSPLAADGDTVTLIELLEPDHVVLVAGAGLGAINAVLLAAASLAPVRPVVLLNHFDESDRTHAGNALWLREHTDLTVTSSVATLAPFL
ncbi:MAG TPA: hypothetical protein VNA57_11130 [Acidimicrobiales bacterium]|nr:hypothetical protein [Acidimicrobiales bacterium]